VMCLFSGHYIRGALILACPKIGGKFNQLGTVGSARFLHV